MAAREIRMNRVMAIREIKQERGYTWQEVADKTGVEFAFVKYLAKLRPDCEAKFTDKTNVKINHILLMFGKLANGTVPEWENNFSTPTTFKMLEKHNKEYQRLWGDGNVN